MNKLFYLLVSFLTVGLMVSCKEKNGAESVNTGSLIGMWESYNFQETGDGGYNRATGEYSFQFDGTKAMLGLANGYGGEGAEVYVVDCPVSENDTKVRINFETNGGEQALVVATLSNGKLIVQEVHETWDWNYVYYCTKKSDKASIK